MKTAELNAAQVAAIAKAIDDKALKSARAAFDPEGEHFDVDFTIHLRGQLEVGPEVETTQINTIQPLKLLLVALNKLNDKTVKTIIEQAMAIDDKDESFIELKKSVADHWKAVAGSTRQMRSGAIKFKGIIEEVDD